MTEGEQIDHYGEWHALATAEETEDGRAVYNLYTTNSDDQRHTVVLVPVAHYDDAQAENERLRAALKRLESGTKDMGLLGVRPLYLGEVREIAFDALHGEGH